MIRMLVRAGAVAALSLAAAPPGGAWAEPRAMAASLSCAAARALVSARGVVILGTGPYTYERVVDHGGLCDRFQTTAPAYVGTADTPQCFVGYRCKDKSGEPKDSPN